jgi:hypothetical protein
VFSYGLKLAFPATEGAVSRTVSTAVKGTEA